MATPTQTPQNGELAEDVEKAFFEIFDHEDFPTIDGRYIEYKRLKAHMIEVMGKLLSQAYQRGRGEGVG